MSWPFDLPLDWPDAPDEPSRFVAYWIAHASTGWTGTPTGAQIAAGNQSNGTAAAFSGAESGFATAGTVSVDEETAITGASPGTEYTQAWVVYDTVDDAYSNVVVGTVSTAATVALSATGSTGTFAGAASSPATAALAATGETGAFSGTASADIAAALAATGNTGSFSGSAYSTATAILAATGNSGIFVGSAFEPATLAATGGTGTFAGTAEGQIEKVIIYASIPAGAVPAMRSTRPDALSAGLRPRALSAGLRPDAASVNRRRN